MKSSSSNDNSNFKITPVIMKSNTDNKKDAKLDYKNRPNKHHKRQLAAVHRVYNN